MFLEKRAQVVFDFLILGNGAIGMLSAIELKKNFPNSNIGIIGSKSRDNSASAAAGAMCNVFAETEATYSEPHNKLMELSLWYGIKGREGWLNLLASNPKLQNMQTATDTLIFLKEKSANFEVKNYEKAKQVVKEYGVLKDLKPDLIKKFFQLAKTPPIDAFQIKSEFALDTRIMFKAFEQICTDLGILTLDTIALEVDFHFSCVSTQTGPVNFNHLIVALGSNSSSVLPPNTIQNLVQGVGTAIEIRKHGNLGYFSQQNSVIRTVNRGGAQCGFHFVPRNEGYYLGAGNYIKTTGQSSHRLETISYLIKTFEHELCGNDISYKLEGNLVKGHRPRSIDGFPLIGYLNKNPKVFVATGTNRAGLTWAPKIANQIVTWAKGDYDNSPFQSLVAPDRELINFGNWNEATSYYAESRLGAAVEHEKIAYTVNELKIEGQRLQQHANELLSKVQNVIKDKNAIPHPDHWALISESPSVYNAIR